MSMSMNAQNQLKSKPTMHHTTTTRHDEKITLGSNKSGDVHAETQKMRLKFGVDVH